MGPTSPPFPDLPAEGLKPSEQREMEFSYPFFDVDLGGKFRKS